MTPSTMTWTHGQTLHNHPAFMEWWVLFTTPDRNTHPSLRQLEQQLQMVVRCTRLVAFRNWNPVHPTKVSDTHQCNMLAGAVTATFSVESKLYAWHILAYFEWTTILFVVHTAAFIIFRRFSVCVNHTDKYIVLYNIVIVYVFVCTSVWYTFQHSDKSPS